MTDWTAECDVMKVLDDNTIEVEIRKRIRVQLPDFKGSRAELKSLYLGRKCKVHIPNFDPNESEFEGDIL